MISTLEYELLNDTGYRMPLADYHMVHKYRLLELFFGIDAEKRILEWEIYPYNRDNIVVLTSIYPSNLFLDVQLISPTCLVVYRDNMET